MLREKIVIKLFFDRCYQRKRSLDFCTESNKRYCSSRWRNGGWKKFAYLPRITIGSVKKPWTNLMSIIVFLDGEFLLQESLCKRLCRLCPMKSLVKINIYNLLPQCPRKWIHTLCSFYSLLSTNMVSGNIFDWLELPTLKYHWYGTQAMTVS